MSSSSNRNSASIHGGSNSHVGSNVLSHYSKFEEGLANLGVGVNDVIKDLEAKGISLEEVFKKWSDYFSEPIPRFKSFDIKQILVLNFCHKFIIDFEANKLNYLTWKRKGGIHSDEVFLDYKIVGIPNNTNQLISSNSYDEKITLLFRHFIDIPEATISACNLALDVLNTHKLVQEPKKVITRIMNTPGLDHVRNSSSSNIGKFLKVRCKVVSVSAAQVYIKSIVSEKFY